MAIKTLFDIDYWSEFYSHPKNRYSVMRGYSDFEMKPSGLLSKIKTALGDAPKPKKEEPLYRIGVTGPESMVFTDLIRKYLWPDLDPTSGIPTDVYVWAVDEPENPAGTKIGGLPYLTRNVAWPVTGEGRPQSFVAQFNLADSKDCLPSLPRDLLLVFSEACTMWEIESRIRAKRGMEQVSKPEQDGPIKYNLSDEFAFVFVDTSRVAPADVIAREHAPDVPFFLSPLHGKRLRYSDHQDLFDAYTTEWADKHGNPRGCPPAIVKASKIGGIPAWEQGASTSEWGRRFGEADGPAFIGQLCTDWTELGAPYPYVGRKDPYDDPRSKHNERLTIADAGVLYLFWDGENVLYEVQGG